MVKNKKIADGHYRFEYKGQTVDAHRQPDLYFIIELGGEQHKGYLKDLKAKFMASIDGVAPAQGERKVRSIGMRPAPDPEPGARPERAGGVRPMPATLTPEQRVQWRIDAAETTDEAMRAYVAAYNAETEKGRTHVVLPPKGAPIVPPLKKCYDKARDLYTWPNEFVPE